ncbi:hypothetical protein HII12_000560 [Brettanomyces bruxellensis]|uniref:Septin-type G domain-containing protein n=1 Tax=Dekkera bruxellensis TaxID=5007 RepID=A0A8H6EZB3_DEKBR|nr:hypothetical protein HII12_000560 [Brettanomyces bruxellensis]
MVTVIESSAVVTSKEEDPKKSLNFTVMVIGQSGTGRSTFINSLCDQLIVEPSSTVKLYSPEELGNPDRELQLRKSTVELEDEEGVRINLNLIDTPDLVIKDYIKYQFDEILIEESKLRRNPRFKDNRVHVCLYFIVPTGHGLREIDVRVIRSLGSFVNILPCISKSDSLTMDELKLNKRLIKEDIDHYNLPVFDFTNSYFNMEDTLDDESIELNKYLQKTMPFAIMGSNATYPWGAVDIFDNEISDVLTLKTTLLVTHLDDFKDYTHEVLYENYRARTLSEVENGEGNGSANANAGTSIASDINRAAEITRRRMASSKISGSLAVSHTDLNSDINKSSIATELKEDEHSVCTSEMDPKEEQIKLEEERLKAFEQRVQRDLLLKRKEIEDRERELAEIEKDWHHRN